jgi:Fe-Mn family superoxide dismutase
VEKEQTSRTDRREFLGSVVAGSVAAATMLVKPAQAADEPQLAKAEPLPYAYDALEPYIDAETMHLHHDKHYQSYADGYNKAAQTQPSILSASPEANVANLASLPESVQTAVRNSGGGFVNHKLFWLLLKKNNGAGPQGELAKAIDAEFGSFTAFQTEFTKAAATVFGSGWAWLALGPDNALAIEQTHNQDSTLTAKHRPVLGIDVWEHAYYLKYQNRRPEYVAAFYNVINWDFVSGRYAELMKG